MTTSPASQTELAQRIDTFARDLSERDRIWASGYLAGLAARGAASDPSPQEKSKTAATPADAEQLTIWYGSETGNARGVAERLTNQAREQGRQVSVESLADVRPHHIRKQKALTLVVSTHGEGDPPEDAESLHEYLTGDNAPSLSSLRFAVFALGDSSYEHFCRTGRDFDAALERLGATRVADRVDADLDFETEEAGWRDIVLEAFPETVPGETAGESRPDPAPQLQVVDSKPRWTRDHPFPAEVLASSPLTVPPSDKSVHHVELSLEDSGLEYRAGDSLGIWPVNPRERVDEILEVTSLSGDTAVIRDGMERSLYDWLAEHRELTLVTRKLVRAWSERVPDDGLQRIAESAAGFREWIRDHQSADLFSRFPGSIDADALVDLLPPLTPRLYSIASSPSAHPDEVHLTVATVGGWHGDRLRAGSGSWHLNEFLTAGDTVRVYVEENPRFRLPEQPDTPVVMIGPGTGVAPFRSFVEERAARGDTGPNWLFFGARNRRTDFLYQLDWQRHRKNGRLDRISLAFSRDRAERVYVQDRLRESGRDLMKWLDDGAHIYVCGDAYAMAPAVDEALRDIVQRHGDRNPDQAREYLAELRKANRYRKDVY